MSGKLPKTVECPRCGGFVPLEEGRLGAHNWGDLPDWMEERVCPLSEQLAVRRKPKRRWRKAKLRG